MNPSNDLLISVAIIHSLQNVIVIDVIDFANQCIKL